MGKEQRKDKKYYANKAMARASISKESLKLNLKSKSEIVKKSNAQTNNKWPDIGTDERVQLTN